MKIAVLGANYQYLSFYKQAKALGYEIISFGRKKMIMFVQNWLISFIIFLSRRKSKY